MLLSRHELCRIYALFWFDFDADFYADIEDFVQLLCRSLHEKMLGGTSDSHFYCQKGKNNTNILTRLNKKLNQVPIF